MLADELNHYKGKGNKYVDENVWEIQDIYIEEEVQDKGKERVEEEEVILIKPFEVSESISTKSSSFINDWQSFQIHEICQNSYLDKNILTTSLLLITSF